MKKMLFQGLSIALIFLGTWYILHSVDWMSLFKVEQMTTQTEEKLGDLLWEVIEKGHEKISNPDLTAAIDSIADHICSSNTIERSKIKVHIVWNDEINAFALPDGHLVIYSGLLTHSRDQFELAGVLSHEIAHIQLGHVSKKLIKEIGLTVLVAMTTGNGGPELIQEVMHLLSSTAFDRSLEREADMAAVQYLVKANISPEVLADFLLNLSEDGSKEMEYFTWISTHPSSKERAEYILDATEGNQIKSEPIVDGDKWKEIINSLPDNR